MTILLYWCNSLFLVGDCRGKRPFQFFNIWSDRDGFLDVIRSVWETTIQGCCSYQISQKLKILKQLLRDKYGKDQIQIDIAKAKADLLDIQNHMHSYPEKSELASDESSFASHLWFLQVDLEGSLRHKAKLQWIKLGDDNTAFFHISITQRIR